MVATDCLEALFLFVEKGIYLAQGRSTLQSVRCLVSFYCSVAVYFMPTKVAYGSTKTVATTAVTAVISGTAKNDDTRASRELAIDCCWRVLGWLFHAVWIKNTPGTSKYVFSILSCGIGKDLTSLLECMPAIVETSVTGYVGNSLSAERSMSFCKLLVCTFVFLSRVCFKYG